MKTNFTPIDIRLWEFDDYPLLERLLGDPAMTVHLGGPETPEQLRARNDRYALAADNGAGYMFVIVVGSDKVSVGQEPHIPFAQLALKKYDSVMIVPE